MTPELLGSRPANAGFQHRGLEYYESGDFKRLIYASHHRKLISLDLKTGKPDAAFGDAGLVDTSMVDDVPTRLSVLTHSAPPIVCGGTIVLGSIISDGPTGPKWTKGHVRGYDVRTGRMKWIFRTIPEEGEFGNDTLGRGLLEGRGQHQRLDHDEL